MENGPRQLELKQCFSHLPDKTYVDILIQEASSGAQESVFLRSIPTNSFKGVVGETRD